MSGESPVNVVWPRYDELLASRDVTFILGQIESIDLKRRCISLSDGTDYGYRHLVLGEFPEVFAGGDCAVNPLNPMPATAQVAYQQGEAIVNNLLAQIQGRSMKPAQANLRGTLLKLGMEKSAASLFDKFELGGKLGDLVRHGTYLSLLPTPAHNLKVGSEWLTEEAFEQVLNV